jgi:hypothetical protein
MKIHIKKIIYIIVIFISITNFCLAEEINKSEKTQSKIGGTIGLQFPTSAGNIGYCGNIFYHQILTLKWFLSANIGLYHYPSPFEEIKNASQTDIPITLGINVFLGEKNGAYLGLEAGILKQDAPFQDGSSISHISNTGGVMIPTFGFFTSLTKNVNLTGNLKLQLGNIKENVEYFGMYSFGFNLGIAYLFS